MNPNALNMTADQLRTSRQAEREADAKIRVEIPDDVAEHGRSVKQAHYSAMGDGMLTVEKLGHLFGDRNGSFGGRCFSPNTKRLLDEVRAGRLETLDNLRYYGAPNGERGAVRKNSATVRCSRAQVLAWLEANGTDDERATAGAKWAAGIAPDDN
jgi:hypothetical protein